MADMKAPTGPKVSAVNMNEYTLLSRDTAGTSYSKLSLKPWFRSVQAYSHVFIQNIIECLQHKTTKTIIYQECTAVRFQIFG